MTFTEFDLEDIRSVIDKANKTNMDSEYTLDYCNAREVDILHELELNNLTYHQQAKLAKELTELRRKRREAKNQLALLEPFIDWKNNHQKSINDLCRVIGKMRTISEKQKTMVYHCRVDPSITIEHYEE